MNNKMNAENSIHVLNVLIEINNDRIEGYKTASKETEDDALKSLFFQLAETSQKCKAELTAEVHKLGGTPLESTRITGKFFRVWMDVKAALTANDRKNILDSCVCGEDVIGDTYKNVLQDNSDALTPIQQKMLSAQPVLLKADRDKIKDLRDMLAEHH
jgi:uncharacterized protein (TIGR02284 family)